MAAQDPHNIPAENAESLRTEQIAAQPSASGANALWLAVTLLNLVLIAFLLPSWLLKNDTVLFIIKVASIVAAAGAFAAGLVWFQNFLTSLPSHPWFKVSQIIAFVVLGLLNVAKLPLVPLYPVVDAGATLEINGQHQNVEAGTVRVSFGAHKIVVSPGKADDGKPWHYSLGYEDVFSAIFRKYEQRWSPLYAVDIKTKVSNVEVLIRKLDGDFDPGFRNKPEPSDFGFKFEPMTGKTDAFIYGASDSQFGSADVVYLPPGEYAFTAHKEGCGDKEIRINIKGIQHGGHTVDFESLCDTTQTNR